MAWFAQSERGIGRGEVAESRIEAPFFAVFMTLCAISLFIFHIYFQNVSWTAAMATSMIVFGATVIKVEFGIYILVIAMLLSPEIAVGAVGGADERGINIRYDDILIVIIFLGTIVKLSFEGRMELWRPNPINAGIFCYLFVAVISTLNALRISVPAWDKYVAFFVLLKMVEFYLIFFTVGLAITTAKDVRRQLVVFFGVASIVSLYAMLSIGRLSRVSAPFEVGGTEPNTLGGYLMIIVCLALGLLLNAPRMRYKVAFVAIGLLSVVPFIMTLSRASYLALLLGVITVGILSRRWWVIVALAIVLVLSPFIMPQDVKDRVSYTFQSGSGVQIGNTNILVDKSTYERVYVWQKVRHNLRVWPWFGGGISWDTVLDSQYARILIETGLFGMAAFIYMLLRILQTTRETYRWTRDWVVRGLGIGMTGVTIGLIVHGMGTISFLIVRIMEPFWFLIALCAVSRELSIHDYAERVRLYRIQLREQAAQAPESEEAPISTPVAS